MAWNDLLSAINDVCVSTFGVQAATQTATFQPRSGGSPISINGIIAPAPLLEQALPGTSGVNVVRFFVNFLEISPRPQKGDTVILDSITYDIFEVDVDVSGGATLKLRAKA